MNAPKNISLKPYYGQLFKNNNFFEINNGLNIFYGLKDKLKKHDIEINTLDVRTQNKPDKYVYCDAPYPWQITEWLGIFLHPQKNILFCFESPIVNPFSHIRLLHIFFNKIYTWNDTVVDSKKYFKFHIPQLNQGVKTKPINFTNKKFLVLINAAKSAVGVFKALSPYKTDLYQKRKFAIDFFERNLLERFALYGPGWGSTKIHPSYRGIIKADKKINIVSQYKFCLCFENTIAPGYITEKIFDCFKARCVPVYLGAPNIEKYVPPECFVDYRKFKNYEELVFFLGSIGEEVYNNYILAIEEFLESKKTQKIWFEEGFEEIFLDAVTKI